MGFLLFVGWDSTCIFTYYLDVYNHFAVGLSNVLVNYMFGRRGHGLDLYILLCYDG